jgi:hypothetical protein
MRNDLEGGAVRLSIALFNFFFMEYTTKKIPRYANFE